MRVAIKQNTSGIVDTSVTRLCHEIITYNVMAATRND